MVEQKQAVVISTIVIIILVLGSLVWVNILQQDSYVISNFEEVNTEITGNDGTRLNVTVDIVAFLVNRGRLEQVELPCSTPKSHLSLKNSTKPLVPYSSEAVQNSSVSVYYTPSVFNSSCDDVPTQRWISEGELGEIRSQAEFGLVTGKYAFIWYHSFAKSFEAVVLDVNVATNSVSVLYE